MTMTARTTSGRARRRRATARHMLPVAAGLRVVALCLAAASLSTIDASYRLVTPAVAAEGDHGNGKGNGNGSGQSKVMATGMEMATTRATGMAVARVAAAAEAPAMAVAAGAAKVPGMAVGPAA